MGPMPLKEAIEKILKWNASTHITLEDLDGYDPVGKSMVIPKEKYDHYQRLEVILDRRKGFE